MPHKLPSTDRKYTFATMEGNDLVIMQREPSCVYAFISVPVYHHSNVKIAVLICNEVFVVVYN